MKTSGIVLMVVAVVALPVLVVGLVAGCVELSSLRDSLPTLTPSRAVSPPATPSASAAPSKSSAAPTPSAPATSAPATDDEVVLKVAAPPDGSLSVNGVPVTLADLTARIKPFKGSGKLVWIYCPWLQTPVNPKGMDVVNLAVLNGLRARVFAKPDFTEQIGRFDPPPPGPPRTK